MSPRAWCRRASLNQPMYSTTESSSCERVRQTRSGMSWGLEAVDEALGQGVVVGVADRTEPNRGEHAVIGQGLGVVEARVLRAAVAVVHERDVGASGGAGRASCPARRAPAWCMWLASCQPTTRREWASMTKAKKTRPSQHPEVGQVGDQNRSGPSTAKVALHQDRAGGAPPGPGGSSATAAHAALDAYRERFGVEPICRVLACRRPPTSSAPAASAARAVEDERLLERIRALHAANYYAYGYRRMWKALVRAGEPVARCRVQRLMRAHGIVGAKHDVRDCLRSWT